MRRPRVYLHGLLLLLFFTIAQNSLFFPQFNLALHNRQYIGHELHELEVVGMVLVLCVAHDCLKLVGLQEVLGCHFDYLHDEFE